MFQILGPVLAAVPLEEGSDEILRQADELASAYGVPLHACHVLPEVFAVRPLFPNLHLRDALRVADLEASVRAALQEQVRAATARDPEPAGCLIEYGSPHAGILRAAEQAGAGLIVVGGKSDRSGLGAAADRVVRNAGCPVLVARRSPAGKVLAATDFSDPAVPAVEAGAAEARRRGADLAVLYAFDLFPVMLSPQLASPEGAFHLLPPPWITDDLRRTEQGMLDECVRQYQAKAGFLVEGPAAPAIVRAAAELPAQLVAIGTHGRTGLQRMAMGSVAESVVRDSPCSTLVVRLKH